MLARAALAIALAGACSGGLRADSSDLSPEARGRYIAAAGGCFACHGEDQGGHSPDDARALKTPFGTFFAPNISPDESHGIGRWQERDFLRAMRYGVRPDGAHYYPSFPYPAFTKASESDLKDLWTYLRGVAPVVRSNRPHELSFPFSLRSLLGIWRLLYFSPGEWRSDPNRSAEWNRGAYLVEALAHCGECHTPRTALGGLDRARWMAGATMPGGGLSAPNLTPEESGLGGWSIGDIVAALELGVLPAGGVFGGEMRDVVRYSTSRLTNRDRHAIAVYLKALPPLESRRRPE